MVGHYHTILIYAFVHATDPYYCEVEGEIRVVVGDGDSSEGYTDEGIYFFDGRVEICFNGTFGSVCDDSWDQNDAIVVCNYFGVDEYRKFYY